MALRNINYVYFDTVDIFGNKILSTFTFDQAPLTFIPDFTTAVLLSSTSATNFFVDDTNSYSNVVARWDYGDGSFSYGLTGKHVYKWPGTYKVKLFLYNFDGQPFENDYVAYVKAYNYLSNKLTFDESKNFYLDLFSGNLTNELNLSRTNSYHSYQQLSATGYTVYLYASGSNSRYYSVDNYYKDKWAHLKRFYKFVEKQKINNIVQDVIIDKITTTSTEVYVTTASNGWVICNKEDKNSIFAGTTGTASFYFTDDSSKNKLQSTEPVFIFANLDISTFYDFYTYNYEIYNHLEPLSLSYLNFEPAILAGVKSRFNPAFKLSITTNGIDGEGDALISSFKLHNINFEKLEIPFVIKLKDHDNYTTKNYDYLSSNNNLPNRSLKNLIFNVVDTEGNVYNDIVYYKDNFEDEIIGSGGFYKGSMVPLSASTKTYKLTASYTINDEPNFAKDTSFTRILQPNFRYITQFYDTYKYNFINNAFSLNIIDNYQYIPTNLRSAFTITTVPSASYGEKEYSYWVSDPDQDTIHKYSYDGTILHVIYLSSATVHINEDIFNVNFCQPFESAAPSCHALDSKNNLYVTLFDSGSVIKITPQGDIVNVLFPFTNNAFAGSGNYVALSGYADENLLTPSHVDVDKNNNVYVSYCNPTHPYIVKFNEGGDIIQSITFENFNAAPEKILIDRNNIVWVATSSTDKDNLNPSINYQSQAVFAFDTDLNLIAYIDKFGLIADMSVDGEQNIWVAHGIDRLTKITYDVANITSTDSYGYVYEFKAGSKYNDSNYVQSIEGLFCTANNEIVALNNFDTALYYFKGTLIDPPEIDSVKTVRLSSADNNFVLYPLSSFYDPKYQLNGDSNGFNWINKFYYPATNFKVITGESAEFKIYPISGNNLFVKVNENFDGTSFYNDLALSDAMQSNPTFFNNFLGQIAGNRLSPPDTATLKVIFEKIANFGSNISDVAKCNVDALLSKCDLFNIQYENYLYPFPPSVKRLIDIFSIRKNLLYGNFNKSGQNFKYLENVGDEIDLYNGSFLANEPIVALEKFSNTYKLKNTTITNGYNSGDTVYLRDYSYNWGWGLVAPETLSATEVGSFYKFFRLKPSEPEVFNNLLDWDSALNTISKTLSTENDWFGDNNIADQNFTYALVKGLKLFTSAYYVGYN